MNKKKNVKKHKNKHKKRATHLMVFHVLTFCIVHFAEASLFIFDSFVCKSLERIGKSGRTI